jgi:alkanesulfonate monooxygenase SsuD/methylene tetrahydromethanopterin reductase-like flavin-dependent oxidoreductase (luciferase family)
MFISAFMGPMSRGPHEDKPLIDLCLTQAEAAAAAGFCLVTFGEQHYNGYEPYCNPLLMGARLAPILGDCWFGTTIMPLAFHHPLRLAEDINIIENLTGGRFIAGVSAGRAGITRDFENFGLDASRRIEIFGAKLDTMLNAWAHEPGEPPLEVANDFDRCILGGRMMPPAVTTPHPMLAIGSNHDDTIASTARRGWPVFLGPCPQQEAAAKFKRYREAMSEAGFDVDHVQRMQEHSLVTRHVIVGATEEEAWDRAERMMGKMVFLKREHDPRSLRELAAVDLKSDEARNDPHRTNADIVQSWLICGAPESVATQIKSYEMDGIPHLNTRFTVGFLLPEDIQSSFELFVREVLPALSPQRYTAPTPRQHAAPAMPQLFAPGARVEGRFGQNAATPA